MATQPQSLVTQGQTEDNGNGWEKLLPLLDPAVAYAPRTQDIWKKLESKLIFYLINTVASSPWLNHLALAGAIYTESGAAHPSNPVRSVHPFLRWAIPDHYPDVASLKPVEALFTYFGDPPQPRGEEAARGYNSLQLHMQLYLQSLPLAERAKLTPFLLPILINTPRLSQFRESVAYKARTKRKEQAFAVTKDLHALVVMGRQRYQWLADLEAQVQQVAELVQHH